MELESNTAGANFDARYPVSETPDTAGDTPGPAAFRLLRSLGRICNPRRTLAMKLHDSQGIIRLALRAKHINGICS
jgi:hypothetical protein